MASRSHKGPQESVAAVAAALTSSDDAAERLAAAAAAIGAATGACRVELWGSAGADGATCRAAWGGAGDHPAEASAGGRSDLDAVFTGGDVVELRAAGPPGDDAVAHLVLHGATRSLTLPLRLGERTVGALTVMHAGSPGKTTATERRRLALFAQLAAGAVEAAGTASAAPALRRADALRTASRAVAVLMECDQAVETVTDQIASLVGGRECRARVFLRNDAGVYVEFPPRQNDGNGVQQERPNDLEGQALAEGKTLTVAADRAVRLATPLLLRGAPLGYLSVITGRAKPFDADEVRDIETLAEQICLSLDVARLRRTVQRLTTIDTLTGLKNREFLYERLAAEIVRARRYQEPLSLILANLDDFRYFNAKHGNHEGNRLLRRTANLMKASIRDRIDVACRYGGEEFALLLPNTPATAAGAGIVAERVRKAVENTHFHDEEDNRLGRMTVSLGIAGFPVHADDADDLVSLATEALRAAKTAGKNRVGLYKLRR